MTNKVILNDGVFYSLISLKEAIALNNIKKIVINVSSDLMLYYSENNLDNYDYYIDDLIYYLTDKLEIIKDEILTTEEIKIYSNKIILNV